MVEKCFFFPPVDYHLLSFLSLDWIITEYDTVLFVWFDIKICIKRVWILNFSLESDSQNWLEHQWYYTAVMAYIYISPLEWHWPFDRRHFNELVINDFFVQKLLLPLTRKVLHCATTSSLFFPRCRWFFSRHDTTILCIYLSKPLHTSNYYYLPFLVLRVILFICANIRHRMGSSSELNGMCFIIVKVTTEIFYYNYISLHLFVWYNTSHLFMMVFFFYQRLQKEIRTYSVFILKRFVFNCIIKP